VREDGDGDPTAFIIDSEDDTLTLVRLHPGS
jgi:hypothetical protein